jgi:hypothetical protein
LLGNAWVETPDTKKDYPLLSSDVFSEVSDVEFVEETTIRRASITA